MKKTSQKDYIEFVRKLHKEKYSYEKTFFTTMKNDIIITCPTHGDFKQNAFSHKRGRGCPKCIYNKFSKNDIIKQFRKVHGNKYDYSLVEYKNIVSKVKIICKKHGLFEQTPLNHKKGQSCPKCHGKNLNINELIESFKKIHKDKYDYSLVNYINSSTKVKIICQKHGIFYQTPNCHKSGCGCPKCNKPKKWTTQEMIKEFKKIHGNKYNYSLVNYIHIRNKVKIICAKHGVFEQTPHNHKNGNGCPMCLVSKGEEKIRNFLFENNIDFIPQYKFKDCKNINELPFDFYLTKHNTCIEFNGLQHYKPITYFGGEIGFIIRKNNDKIKKEYCKNNKIPLIIIKYNDNICEKLKHIKL